MRLSMSALVVIPARFASTRFPGKPLHPIAGVPMLARVHRIAAISPGVRRVVIATDSSEIAAFCAGIGADHVMTPEECRNGSERTAAAVAALDPEEEIVVNLQGDAVLTPPWVIGDLVAAMRADPTISIATPAVALDAARLEEFLAGKRATPASGTTVVTDDSGDALYFSKHVLPFPRVTGRIAVKRHIGIYAYRRAALAMYAGLEPSPLEESEGLEQLRWLERGHAMRVVMVDYRDRTHGSVDAPEDVAVVEAIIAREGELVP
jgi:3-deoxy-manno-octulosonate cytidylyltransferase (CMP-KDO synthetase)